MVAVVLVGSALIGLSLAPTWQVALPLAMAFGIGDGTTAVLHRSLVTEAAPAPADPEPV